MGSKKSIAQSIYSLMFRGIDDRTVPYVEPFLGGGHVMELCTQVTKIGNDLDPYVVVLHKAMQEGWEPPPLITESMYQDLKSKRALDPLTAYTGYCLSYGGKWFGGYRRDERGVKGDRGNERRQSRIAMEEYYRQRGQFEGVQLHNKSYDELPIPDGSVVYCDPPYSYTQPYQSEMFNPDNFIEWAKELSKSARAVYISEYRRYPGTREVWRRTVTKGLRSKQSSKSIERLFIVE